MDQSSQSKSVALKDNERQLATQASNDFKAKKYDSCLQNLKKLAELRGNDPRITFNKGVVEYYQFGLCKTDDFRKCLVQVKKQLDYGMYNTGDERDDIDRSFLLFDEAVIHYYLKQPHLGISILERLFKVIESLDDSLAVKVCFLLVNLYLTTFKLKQAQSMINYMENVVFATKTTSYMLGEVKSDDSQNNSGSSQTNKDIQIPEQYKSKIHMLKAQLYLSKRSLKECKRELKILLNENSSAPPALFMKSNFEYLRGNCPKSIKLLNIAQKNGDILETGQSLNTMFYNNMGCVHFKMGRYNLAVTYSQKALQENANAMKNLPPLENSNSLSGRPLPTLALNYKNEIMYNIGVQLLFAGKPDTAFDCFMQAHKLYHGNPLYWLRLAECCIGTHQKALRNFVEHQEQKSSYVRNVVGAGFHRKIVISPVIDISKKVGAENQSSAMPSATLDFGNICLLNAMVLLPSATQGQQRMQDVETVESGSVKNEEPGKEPKVAEDGDFEPPAPPGYPLKLDVLKLRLSILACHSYIALGLGDCIKALDYANELLRQELLPGAYRFIGMLYKAEALIKLDKISDAILELNPENLQDLSISPDKYGDESTPERGPNSPDFRYTENEAKAIILLNLASAYCLRNDYEKGKAVLQQAGNWPTAIQKHAILLAVYAELQLGNLTVALNLLKRGEVFSSGRLVDRMDITQHVQANQGQGQIVTLQIQPQQQHPQNTSYSQMQPRSFAPGLMPNNQFNRTLEDLRRFSDCFNLKF